MMGFESQTLADIAAIIWLDVALSGDNALVFGQALSITLMAFCATMLCRLLTRHQWISYIGVALLLVVAGDMLHSSWDDMGTLLGI